MAFVVWLGFELRISEEVKELRSLLRRLGQNILLPFFT